MSQRHDSTATLLPLHHTEAADGTGPSVGECVDDRHPTLTGRVRVRCGDEMRWLATLRGLAVRVGDRVLVVRPDNWEEPIVVGVIDGFARRPRPSRVHAATLDLRADEAVAIRTEQGNTLLELTSTERGAEITLMGPDVTLEIDGRLEVAAKSIKFVAREGEARIEACDDVVVTGENIHLN